MELHHFEDPTEFRARTESFLSAHEAENNLLFGLSYAIATGGYSDFLLCTLDDADGPRLAALMTPPHNLTISHCAPDDAASLARALRDFVIPSVHAETNAAKAFVDAWGVPAAQTMSQRLYRLTTVAPVPGVNGTFRRATNSDVDILTAWASAFNIEALGEHHDLEMTRRNVEARVASDDSALCVWEVDGSPVAMAGRSGPTPNGIRINAVYTPPEQRGHGYASACVAALSEHELRGGRAFCFLYTDLGNPTSNSIYQKIGYSPVCDTDVYRFETASR